MPRLLVTVCLLFVCLGAFAQLRLPSLLSSNMVLQRNATVKLWGWAGPGEKIKVHVPWSNKVDSTVSTRDAAWSLNVQTPDAGGPYTITIQGNTTVKLENVLIGEVWVCGGQSNMEWSGNNKLKEIQEELPVCADNNIRFFQVPKTTSGHPQDDVKGSWTACDASTLQGFSAVGYFFGKTLRKDLNVPIGLINSSWGGTPAEVWTPAETVENNETLKAAAAKLGPNNFWPSAPGRSYNGMIYPLTQFRIAGAIWYQGESNVNTYYGYTQLFSEMIGAWRKAWGYEFPFYFVQIAPFRYGPGIKAALLREAQTATLKTPRTGMAVITDLAGDTTDIHPQQKRAVSLRLANWALAETYGKKGLEYKSPMYERMEQQKDKIVVHFANAENGLTARGGKPLQFFIAGADKKFVPAEVKLKGNTAIISAKTVKQPEAVRFAFGNSSVGNVFNSAGLPLNPFRTDNWEE